MGDGLFVYRNYEICFSGNARSNDQENKEPNLVAKIFSRTSLKEPLRKKLGKATSDKWRVIENSLSWFEEG